jgi:hypothetical protein
MRRRSSLSIAFAASASVSAALRSASFMRASAFTARASAANTFRKNISHIQETLRAQSGNIQSTIREH